MLVIVTLVLYIVLHWCPEQCINVATDLERYILIHMSIVVMECTVANVIVLGIVFVHSITLMS